MPNPLPPLAQQVILITGASSGIGAALAQSLATRYPGIRLVLAARTAVTLEQLATQYRQLGAEILVVPTDMAAPEQVQTLATTAIAHFGRVDSLVNNAGYGQMGPVELVPIAAAQHQFAVNVLGVVGLIQALIPTMRQQGGGRILNISSIAGRLAFPFGGLYSASKFALEGLSDTLRMELSPFNIQVSVIEPGPVQTNFFQVATQGVEQTIPDPQKTPYRAAFAQIETLEQRVGDRAWSSEQVVAVILKALTDPVPRPRYLAATGGRVLLFLMTKLLPTKMVDGFWQRFYGIDLVERDWKNRLGSLPRITVR
ncbi:short-chain dehydrogenase [Neosynechococcus sphagnicola sy1]|uniref:Short-chain dehydrogenase n=1 Tax=Neosynechococcus sphagnicola sy1 TaxID=1497020 RepID=A0A098TNN3_9CYAN|nr:SDR family oxidoreductase [Neosynechococcus sphagnicola]KGF73871.1 short-chain dehydrogenase [Neosynechococcus sphagnicola sy1]